MDEDSWPTIVRDAPELQYPETLNLATLLVDDHVARGAGARIAILAGPDRITYGQLQRLTNRIGGALRALGVQPGDRVAMRFLNGVAFVATWLAVQKIGAVGVSTMPMLRARELGYIVNDSEASVVVCQRDLTDELDRARSSFDHAVTVVSDEDLLAERLRPERGAGVPNAAAALGTPSESERGSGPASREDSRESVDAAPVHRDDVALIAYTSGSTGVPKGATHTPAAILSSADCYGRHVLETRPEDVYGGHPTLAFTFGLGGLLVFPFRAAACTSLIDRFSPETLLARVAADRITVLFCAATTYRLLLQDPNLERDHDLRSLRLCVSAGEPLPAAVYDEWRRRTGVEILDGIGSTEMFHIFISARPG